jgi:MtN3 and saliva related transmembrane protein
VCLRRWMSPEAKAVKGRAMSNHLIVDIVGVAAALCSMTSFAPQLIKIWRERDASAVSLRT